MSTDNDLQLDCLDLPTELPEGRIDARVFNEMLSEDYARLVRSGRLDVRAAQRSLLRTPVDVPFVLRGEGSRREDS